MPILAGAHNINYVLDAERTLLKKMNPDENAKRHRIKSHDNHR